MEWKEFNDKYVIFKNEFNEQDYNERVRTSRLMSYEAIRELIRSKKNLLDAIAKIDERIKQLTPELDDFIREKATKF